MPAAGILGGGTGAARYRSRGGGPVDGLAGARPTFRIALRGYDCEQVHAALEAADAAMRSASASQRAATAEELRNLRFSVVPRGYRRADVKRYMASLLERLG